MDKQLSLILGGARSGKSAFAQQLAQGGGRVLFVGTATAGDQEMAQRIAVHRSGRPASWDTLEEPVALVASLAPIAPSYSTVLIDCLTLWISNLLLRNKATSGQEPDILAQTEQLLQLYAEGRASWIIVSNEVGLGIVPPSSLGRVYRDVLGRVNRLVASQADKVYFMMAGLPLELKALGAQHLEPGDQENTP